jgi:Dioxygenase
MLTRREVLQKCLALGSIVIASDFSADSMLFAFQKGEKPLPKPTPPNPLGPFYKRLTPVSNILRAPGDPGLLLTLSGQVFDTRGDVVPVATIEIWQTNHHGLYDVDGYRYRGKQTVDTTGAYSFESVIPGHYPDKSRVCQHVHYVVMARGTSRWSRSSTSPPIPPSRAILRGTTPAILCSKPRSLSVP